MWKIQNHITLSILTLTWLVSMLIHKDATLTPSSAWMASMLATTPTAPTLPILGYFWGYHHVYAAIYWFQIL